MKPQHTQQQKQSTKQVSREAISINTKKQALKLSKEKSESMPISSDRGGDDLKTITLIEALDPASKKVLNSLVQSVLHTQAENEKHQLELISYKRELVTSKRKMEEEKLRLEQDRLSLLKIDQQVKQKEQERTFQAQQIQAKKQQEERRNRKRNQSALTTGMGGQKGKGPSLSIDVNSSSVMSIGRSPSEVKHARDQMKQGKHNRAQTTMGDGTINLVMPSSKVSRKSNHRPMSSSGGLEDSNYRVLSPNPASTRKKRKKSRTIIKRFLKLADGTRVEIPNEEFDKVVFSPSNNKPKIIFCIDDDKRSEYKSNLAISDPKETLTIQTDPQQQYWLSPSAKSYMTPSASGITSPSHTTTVKKVTEEIRMTPQGKRVKIITKIVTNCQQICYYNQRKRSSSCISGVIPGSEFSVLSPTIKMSVNNADQKVPLSTPFISEIIDSQQGHTANVTNVKAPGKSYLERLQSIQSNF